MTEADIQTLSTLLSPEELEIIISKRSIGIPMHPNNLSAEQQTAKDMILQWLKEPGKQEFRLGGYAGTGKTHLIKDLVETLKDKITIGISAFTGKAVSVLKKKGVYNACTLHTLMYTPNHCKETNKVKWIKYLTLPQNFIIVDEASMVSNELYKDLIGYDVKILFVGDPAQLEPVGDNPNLMRLTDYTLTQIHRQAVNNPIISLSMDVRNGMPHLKKGIIKNEVGSVNVISSLKETNLKDHDIVICAKNITRHIINAQRRIELGYSGTPQEGESIICLKNNKALGLFNGMITTIVKMHKSKKMAGREVYICDLQDELGVEYLNVPVRAENFGVSLKMDMRDKCKSIPFDFAYCLTAHKSQGSSWGNVLVINERLYETDFTRWMYTAFTRSETDLTIIL